MTGKVITQQKMTQVLKKMDGVNIFQVFPLK